MHERVAYFSHWFPQQVLSATPTIPCCFYPLLIVFPHVILCIFCAQGDSCYGTIISNLFFYLFSLSTILSLHLILSSHMTPQLRSTVPQHISVSQHMACACLSLLCYRSAVHLTLYTCLPFSIYSMPSSILVP